MMPNTQDLYLLSDHLENIRRATVPSSDPEAQRYVDRFGRNGSEMVRGNGKGVPLLNAQTFREAKAVKGGWKVPAPLRLPADLVLQPDRQVHGGVLLCPERDMTMSCYAALLTQVALSSEYIQNNRV